MSLTALQPIALRYPKLSHQKWTPEQSAKLLELYTADKSFSVITGEINAEFGTSFTRNAVIGRSHRENFPTRKQRVNQSGYARPKTPRAPRPVVIGFVAPPPPPLDVVDRLIPLEQRKCLLELGAHDCRWPVGDPTEPAFFFCGAVADADHAYCGSHRKRAAGARW